ncbi:hypothetical protein FXV91_12990 [Methanosarcina sp. DH2]|uniref:hypothetical protein n=1 Tax=Methanosarcina sp. DH2 TaxID=2605639 RepID=UPI001E468DE2|nr:hypothetical protein [Methanosarcina sp. DH2]MCC4771048.1 hypothetical protein [Methanosarcina sp. DH2]
MKCEIEYYPEKYSLHYNLIPLYLQQTGWSKADEKDGAVKYYFSIDGVNKVPLTVPNPNASDFQFRLRDLIRVLEAVEKKGRKEIIESINNVDKDVWKISIAKDSAINSLSVSSFEKIIKNLKNLIEYSASAEQVAKPYFEQSLSTGKSYSKKCRIGHTFRGSYGITIETPVEEPINDTENYAQKDQYTPIGRKVTERIFRSLKLIEQEKYIEDLTSLYEESINGNICVALRNLLELSEGDIEYAVNFSPIWDAPKEMVENPKVCIKHSNISYLNEIYEKLHQEYETITNCTVIGTIIELKHIFNEEDESDYNIRILGHRAESQENDYHITLKKGDYLKACLIHTDSVKIKKNKLIEVSGNLRRTKNKWFIDSYSNFNEIHDERTSKALKSKNQAQLISFKDVDF